MKEMVATLKKPRRVMMLVKAGSAVDDFIEQLVSVEIFYESDYQTSSGLPVTISWMYYAFKCSFEGINNKERQ